MRCDFPALTRLIPAGVTVLAMQGIARADNSECGGMFDPPLSDNHKVRLGRIRGESPQTHFVKSGYDAKGCPNATASCRARAFLVPGDRVVLGPLEDLPAQISWARTSRPIESAQAGCLQPLSFWRMRLRSHSTTGWVNGPRLKAASRSSQIVNPACFRSMRSNTRGARPRARQAGRDSFRPNQSDGRAEGA
jgi:hypothetical protein